MQQFSHITHNISRILKKSPFIKSTADTIRSSTYILRIKKGVLYKKNIRILTQQFCFDSINFSLWLLCYCMCLVFTPISVVRFNATNYVKFIHHIEILTQTYHSISHLFVKFCHLEKYIQHQMCSLQFIILFIQKWKIFISQHCFSPPHFRMEFFIPFFSSSFSAIFRILFV